jgi:ubiquinone/menaquinone biosynthesis C-methylase UbiE
MANVPGFDIRLESFYKLFPWPEDPYIPEGRGRYDSALKFFRELVKHRLFEDIITKKELRVLDVCGGTGIGGVALAKALSERGAKVRLTILDLREAALRTAEKFSAEELGEPSRTCKMDARSVHTLGEKFDIALLYGLATPHFDDFSLVQLLASVASSLDPCGVFLVEEVDRFYSLTILGMYKDIYYEGDENKGVISLQVGYDPLRGVVKRLYFNPFTGERAVLEMRYWNLSTPLALAWVFFEEVDFYKYAGRNDRGIIVAKKPRSKLKPEELKPPGFLERQ